VNTTQSFAEQLREAIFASGRSSYSISQKTGISKAALSRFMSGKGGLALQSLDKLVAELDLQGVTTHKQQLLPLNLSPNPQISCSTKISSLAARTWEKSSAPKVLSPHIIAGLFAGIGGIELGLGRSGHETKFLCEIDDGACSVLNARFPKIPHHRDVREPFTLSEETKLLTAGFPCQDLSQAGQTKGINGARSGLVGEVFKIAESRRIPWLLLENVPFMLQLSQGEALEVIFAALENMGYRWAYRVVDSRAFGLPQRRRRVYILAALDDDPRTILFADDVGEQFEPTKQGWRDQACGFYWTEGLRGLGWAFDAVPTIKGGSTIGIPSPPAIVLPGGEIVTPDIRDAERLQGFESGWTDAVKKIGTRWKLVGNAVSVNTAEWIGRRMCNPGYYDDSADTPLERTTRWPTAAWNVEGRRMLASSLSEWPEARNRPHLVDFLKYEPKPLSARAAKGFYSRAIRAKLDFPPGFLDIVRKHYELQESKKIACFSDMP
jgi:DNA (cytosine-5)-methyltransferase 1